MWENLKDLLHHVAVLAIYCVSRSKFFRYGQAFLVEVYRYDGRRLSYFSRHDRAHAYRAAAGDCERVAMLQIECVENNTCTGLDPATQGCQEFEIRLLWNFDDCTTVCDGEA